MNANDGQHAWPDLTASGPKSNLAVAYFEVSNIDHRVLDGGGMNLIDDTWRWR